ncbi:MAG TPA: hypothetical protein PK076_03705 [Saprospiraceae bacterium]|nr:hypothetical protein [Saprospiraceae bacterium]HQW55201.1 hypothetical protein [Saprospiraceae bacterium]
MNKIFTPYNTTLQPINSKNFPFHIVQETLDAPISHLAALIPKHQFNPTKKSIDFILAYSRKESRV